MDRATFFGLLIGIGGIIAGNFIEGGQMASLVQGTAFLIVMSGTIGAVLVSNRAGEIKLGVNLFKQAFSRQKLDYDSPIREIVDCSRTAKKESLFALEAKLPNLQAPLLREVLKNVIDGVDPKLTRQIFDNIIEKNTPFLNMKKFIF